MSNSDGGGGCSASLVASSFRRSMFLAVVGGEIASVVGVSLAYVYGVAAGGSIVVAAIAVYASVFVLRSGAEKKSKIYSVFRTEERKEVEGVSADGGER